MNSIHQRRLILVLMFIGGLALSAGFIFYALKQNMNVFLAPSEISTANLKPHYHFRLGGVVKPHSLHHDKNGLGVQFEVTDYKHDLDVRYDGILPDLFREGKGVIAEGSIDTNGTFIATEVLAKHDENYMPKAMSDRINHGKGSL